MQLNNITGVYDHTDTYGRWHIHVDTKHIQTLQSAHVNMKKTGKGSSVSAAAKKLPTIAKIQFDDDIVEEKEMKVKTDGKFMHPYVLFNNVCVLKAKLSKKIKSHQLLPTRGQAIAINLTAKKYKYEGNVGWAVTVNSFVFL